MAVSGKTKNKRKDFYCCSVHRPTVVKTRDLSECSTAELLHNRRWEWNPEYDPLEAEFQEILREELAKRPHLRNSMEAKLERKLKQQAKQNR